MIRILQGDARAMLAALLDASVHMVVTSPPYFGLRDYGTATWEGGDAACGHVVGEIRTGLGMAALGEKYRGGGVKASEPKPMTAKHECPHCGARRIDQQMGLENSPEAYIAAMVEVFREVRRVLRPDGTLWLNMGDSYNNFRTQFGPGQAVHGRSELRGKPEPLSGGRGHAGLKEKELMMMPARLALALQADGWWIRSNIIWSKPNPMPESVTDRPTSAHEHVFLLTKSGATTFWTHRDHAGTRSPPLPDYRWVHAKTGHEMDVMPADWDTHEHVRKLWRRINLWRGHDYFYDADAVREEGTIAAGTLGAKGSAERFNVPGVNSRPPEYKVYSGTRNMRNVWTIATAPYSEAHFATFPPELAERCIKAGTSERGCCAQCGAPWVRQTQATPEYTEARANYARLIAERDTNVGRLATGAIPRPHVDGVGTYTTGWAASCECQAGVVPATVLDPFAGAFTAPMLADRLQRHAIGIELSQSYCDMARARIERDAGLFAEIAS